jgi:hypothetical protein
MGHRTGGDFNRLRNDLTKLQRKWERKLVNPAKRSRDIFTRGVLFGIETGRATIMENSRNSLPELNTLLLGWEQIGAQPAATLVGESLRGIDFGIRLVIRCVRRCLDERSSRKFTNGDRGSNPPSDDQRD